MRKTLLTTLLLLAAGQTSAADISQFLGTLRIDGRLQPGDAQKFEIELNNKPRRIVIRSDGGRVKEANKIARLIEASGLPLEVREYCVSACASRIFLAASKRTIRNGGFVAFHAGPISVARQVVPLLKEYAAANDDGEMNELAAKWQEEMLDADLEPPASVERFHDMLEAVDAATAPVIDAVQVDKAAHRVTFTAKSKGACDYWIPTAESLANVGISISFPAPDLNKASRLLGVPVNRIFQSNIADASLPKLCPD